LKRYKLQGTYAIPAELIQAGGGTLHSEIYKFINSVWNMKELLEQWKKPIIAPNYNKGDNTDCSNY
jgi:hypothetical protein